MCTLNKKYITCILRENKPFWLLSRLGDLAVSGNRSPFVHGSLNNLPKNFLYIFREGGFSRKNTGRIKE